jgi:hypothetical protein
MDSQALSDFARRLQDLAGDLKSPLYTEAFCTDELNDNLADFSSDDAACGASLNNYLTTLATMATQAAAAAQKMDDDLAAAAREPHHGRMEAM